MLAFILSVIDWKYRFWINLIQKIKTIKLDMKTGT